MATVTTLDTGTVGLDRTWQRQGTTGIVEAYAKVTASVVEETSSSITVTVGGAIMYGGYLNYIPYQVGIRQVFADGTSKTVYEDKYMQTTSYSQASNWNWFSSSTFTFNKTSQSFGLLPFVKIGCIEYSEIDDGNDFVEGNDWMFGGNYGILVGYRFASTVLKGDMTHTSPINGFSKTIPAFIIFAGNNTTSTGYSNAKLIVDAAGCPVYVYNSSGVHKQATAIYVYNASGVPKRATSITVYDSNGTPHTMSC